MPFAWFLVKRVYHCEGCPMPFAWFWQVVVTIVVDILCHLYGFGESWLQLWWISYAICMVLVSRG